MVVLPWPTHILFSSPDVGTRLFGADPNKCHIMLAFSVEMKKCDAKKITQGISH